MGAFTKGLMDHTHTQEVTYIAIAPGPRVHRAHRVHAGPGAQCNCNDEKIAGGKGGREEKSSGQEQACVCACVWVQR